jgi:hypothetical protein
MGEQIRFHGDARELSLAVAYKAEQVAVIELLKFVPGF